MQGIEVLSDHLLRIREIPRTDEDAVTFAHQIFDTYKAQGILLNACFEEDTWQIHDELHTVSLRFSVSEQTWEQGGSQWLGCSCEAYVLTLKVLIALCLGQTIANTLQAHVRGLVSMAGQTREEVSLEVIPVSSLVRFLELLPGESLERDDLMDMAESLTMSFSSKRRILAPFQTYVSFHEQFQKMYAALETKEHIRFFPIWLWWNYSMILPTRTMELLLIPRNCLTMGNGKPTHAAKTSKENEISEKAAESLSASLTVRKTKLKKGRKQVTYRICGDYELCTYPIPQALATEIQWYLNATADCRVSALDTLLIPEGKARYFSYAQMRTLLAECTERFQLEGIRLGDTRHLAMISLALSGHSPEVCKELARHANFQDSSHYFANLTVLLDSTLVYLVRQSTGSQDVLFLPIYSATAMTAQGRSRVHEGSCEIEDIAHHIQEYCAKNYSAAHGLGCCLDCVHYIPDTPGVRISMQTASREDMHANFQFLLEEMELFAKKNTHGEGLMAAWDRFRTSAHRYAVLLGKEV